MAVITPVQQTSIANLYTALFNRAPDAAGFEFWSQALLSGASLSSLTSAFLSSPESTAIYAPSQSAEQFVATFYQTVFGRAPDDGGLTFWTGVLNGAGGVGSSAAKALLVSSIVEIVSTPMTTKPAGMTEAQYAETVKDRDTFGKKAVVGIDFAVNLKSNDLSAAKQAFASVFTPTTPTPTAPTGPITPTTPPPVTDPVISLITGQDTKTGTAGNDTFDARQVGGLDTLTTGDVLDGGDGIDTLNVSLGSSTEAAPTLRNIEIVNLTAVGSNVSLDLGSLTGLTQANIVQIPFDAQVRLQNVGAAALSISTLSYGSHVNVSASFTGSTGEELKLSFNNLQYSGIPIKVTLGAEATALNIVTTNSFVELLKDASSAEVTDVTVNATGYGVLKLSEVDAGKVKNITVGGTGSIDFSGRELSALETFTAGNGAARFVSTAATALNVTTGDGADYISANGTSIRSLIVGGGNDTITINGGALTAGAKINLGAGNDILSVQGGLVDNVEIDGGDGDDTLNLTLNAAGLLRPTLRSVETVNLLATASGASIDLAGSGARIVSVTGSSSGATVSNVGDAALAVSQLSGGTAAVAFGGSTSEVLSLKLDTLSNSASKININLAAMGIGPLASTYAITTNYAHVQLLGEAANLSRVTVAATGVSSLNLSAPDAGKITSLVVTGTGSVDFSGQDMSRLTSLTAANGGVKLVSSNASAGVLDVVTGDGVDAITAVGASIKTLNVGAGNDVVTLITSALAAGASIDLGAGNDTLIMATSFVAGGTINGGAGRDTLQINEVTPNYAAINGVVDFEVLALGASGATVDVGQITNSAMSNFAIANTGTTSFTNAKAGSAFSIETRVNVAEVNIASAGGVASATLTLNNSGATAAWIPQPAVGALSVTGASTISLTSSGSGTNAVTKLTTSTGATVNIDGTADLLLSLASGTGGVIDATSFTGRLTLTASDIGAVLTGGRGADTLVGGTGNDTITGGTASGNNVADILTGGAGNDNFKFLSLAETRNNDLLNNLRTDAALMDRITDFNGNGAGVGDSITFGIGANAFGAGLTFTTGTTAVVKVAAVSNATDIRSLNDKVWAEVGATAVSSTSAVAQVYDVTVTGGTLAGRYLIMDNGDGTVNVADTMILLTGITGALDASDILFAA